MRVPPDVTLDMLDATFWLDWGPDPDASLLAPEAIASFNAHVYESLGIPLVLDLPDSLPREEVETHMRSGLPGSMRYTAAGQPAV
jgi:hypothetical protein